MTTAAEQYRALVARLEAINPSETVNEEETAPAPAAALAPVGAVADAPSAATVNPDKYKPNDKIPEIKAGTLAQAKQIALKQLGPGKKFRFCMTYGTKLANTTKQDGMEKPQDNWSRLGGTNVVKPAEKK